MIKRVNILSPEQALIRAIEIAGSKRALARATNSTHQAISKWTRVPAEKVLRVEKATGISRHALRPDIYPTE